MHHSGEIAPRECGVVSYTVVPDKRAVASAIRDP